MRAPRRRARARLLRPQSSRCVAWPTPLSLLAQRGSAPRFWSHTTRAGSRSAEAARAARAGGRRLSSWEVRQSSQPSTPGASVGADQPRPGPEKVSEQLERWLSADGVKSLGSLIALFEEKSFAIL